MYDKLSDTDKKKILNDLYHNKNYSLSKIAEQLNTYTNKLRRDAAKFGIKLRDKSAAQKNALNTGSHKHPTKGQIRSDAEKRKIGKSVMESWSAMSDDELTKRKQKSKDQWDRLSEDQKKQLVKSANEAVRRTSKEGSKLEKFLLSRLISDGYKVDFHKEHILLNSKLQIDLFLPTMNIAIEVDGPSHFENIWGDDALTRNTKYDQKKDGILLGKGLKIIRIKQTMDFSETRSYELYDKIKTLLDSSSSINNISYLSY